MTVDLRVVELLEPENLIGELRIVGEEGDRRKLAPFWLEQEEYLDWFFASLRGEAPRNAYILKSRQMGISTVVVASLFIKAYLAPSWKPRTILTIGHEEGACKRMIRMVRNYATELPPELRPGFEPDNKFSIGFGHNGSTWASLMAGGRGQGRSETYTDLHATEMAFWPQSSSASAGADTPADQDAWSSVAAVIHDPGAHKIIESTANGPRGFFHKMDATARDEEGWRHFFFPWTMQRRYRRPVPDPERMLNELDDYERRMYDAGHMDLEQVAFRRLKLHTEGYSLTRFRREYPLTRLDPFLSESGGWFDDNVLNDLAAHCPRSVEWPLRGKWTSEWTQWHAYDPKRLYAMGIDTSGGTGGDDAVIYVLRDDYVPVAKWRSNRRSPKQQAAAASRIGGAYGKPLCLIECNKFGLEVAEELQRLGGVRMLKPNGKWFYSTGKASGNNKRKVYVWARHVLDNRIATVHDDTTISQLLAIVEHTSGMIAPASSTTHDDAADAWVFAAFACRRIAGKVAKLDPAEQREEAIRRFKKRIGAPHA